MLYIAAFFICTFLIPISAVFLAVYMLCWMAAKLSQNQFPASGLIRVMRATAILEIVIFLAAILALQILHGGIYNLLFPVLMAVITALTSLAGIILFSIDTYLRHRNMAASA